MNATQARECAEAYYEVSHTDFFSPHSAAGHGCACSLCLRECGCALCTVRLMWRMIGGAK